jgi:hypothetical protein
MDLRNETWGKSIYFRTQNAIGLIAILLSMIRPKCSKGGEIVSGGDVDHGVQVPTSTCA